MGQLKINGTPVLKFDSFEVVGDGSDPALKVNQEGTGRGFDFQENGISYLYYEYGGHVKLARILDFISNQAVNWPSAGDNANNTLLQWTSPSEDTIKLTFDTRNGIKKITLRNTTDAFSVFDTDWDSGGVFTLYQQLDARQAIKNAGASNGGEVAVDDSMRVAGNFHVYTSLGGSIDAGLCLGGFLKLVERPNHPSDASIPEDYAYAYVYHSGATRQFTVKYKDGGQVYTGTIDLA